MKKLFNALSLVLILSMVITAVALAADANIENAFVDAEVQDGTGYYLLSPGDEVDITIGWKRTGRLGAGWSFDIFTKWELQGDPLAFVGSIPETIPLDETGAPPGETTGSVNGTVKIPSNAVAGTYSFVIAATNIVEGTGQRLNVGGTQTVTVVVVADADDTPPVITYTVNGVFPPVPDGDNGWYVSDALVEWSVSDPESDFDIDEGCVDTLVDYDTTGVTFTCKATSEGGTTTVTTEVIKRDATKPTIDAALSPDAASTGWWNIATGAPTVTYTCDDATSGVASCTAPFTFGEGANQSDTGTAVDFAGNSETATVEGVDVDLTAPGIVWSNGPEDGESYYFGFVPEEPTCEATDALSGPGDCDVTGYGTTVGSHTLTATAYDLAGNETTETRTYTVLAWEATGFYRPVRMGDDVINTVRRGSTVPLKFNVYAGETELTNPAVVKSITWVFGGQTSTFTDENELDEISSGGTVLRYDADGGQFIFNWKTPTAKGVYVVSVNLQDGTSITATFNLR